ncbi:MAG: transcriptional regulator [Anaerocolumna sp.]|jgi:AcrR family transcriptional regulator|nr:transcriptional regulator [Anaerocolumna sp.]
MSPRINLDKEAILRVAAEIADRDGLDAVTIATLAKKLNIKSPSLYNHINGMSDLRKQLAIYGIEELYNALINATIGIAGEEAIHSFANAYVTFARNHHGLYDAVTQISMQSDEQLQVAGSKTVELVSRVLGTYKLNKEDEIHTVRGLRSMLHGFASIEKNGGFGIPINVDESLRKMVDTYLLGMQYYKKDE